MPHVNKQMISFFLTTRCNLCCSYCYNMEQREQLEEMSLPLEVAIGGIDWYFKNNSSRHIRFYGPGEPTYELGLMRDITEYAKKVGGAGVTSELQTNGIWTEETRNWILDNLNIVWMSFDGLPEIHNKLRPLNKKYVDLFGGRTSSKIVEDNTRFLIQNKDNRNLKVGARVTMTDDNIKQQREMVDYFYDLGIRHVWTNPLFASVCVKPYAGDKNYFDMPTYIEHYIDAYKYAKSKGLFWGSFLIINFDGETEHHCRACTPLKAPHITPDGYLSACDLVLLGKEPHHMQQFVFGKWNDDTKAFDIYQDRVDTLLDRRAGHPQMKHCQKCEAQKHCGGYCPGEVLNETGTLYGQKAKACAGVKKLFKELGKLEKFDLMHP